MTPPVHAVLREKAELIETYIADEDEGSPVGILCELLCGTQIWSGEVSDHLLSLQEDDARLSRCFVMVSEGGQTRVVAQVATTEDGILIAQALARQALSHHTERKHK